MPAWLAIGCWWTAFIATHLLLSTTAVRGALIGRVGARGFQGLYSLVAFATFIPLVATYWGARHTGPLLWYLRDVPGVTSFALLINVLAFVMLFASLRQPSPLGMVPGARPQPYGITRVTRHPLFAALAIWGAAHMLVNGWLSDVVFFGGFVVMFVLGSSHQDHRKRAAEGERLAEFFAQTSLVPFAAMARQRQRLTAAEVPWGAVLLGTLTAFLLYAFHLRLFGLPSG